MFPTICLLHPVTDEYVEAKRAKGLCRTWRCNRPARSDRFRCSTCDSRLHRLRHPDHYAFVALKASAYKRRIKFELTLEEFRTFCRETGYLEKKGTEPHSFTIDRRFTDQPYRLDNIRIMSHADNSSHRFEERSDDAADNPY